MHVLSVPPRDCRVDASVRIPTMRTACLTVLLVASALPACSKRASDMQLVCEAGERSGAMKLANPNDRASHTAQWIKDNVSDQKLLKQFWSLADYSGDKGEILRMMAKENGYTGPCPMADEASKPPPPAPLFGWWAVIETNGERHAALKGGQMRISADEMLFVWPDGETWEAYAVASSQNGATVTLVGRTAFSDEGTIQGTITGHRLDLTELVAVPLAPGTAARLDADAADKLPPADICARAMACANEAAPIKDQLELRDDPVRALAGAGRTLCHAQLIGNAGMFERKKLAVPAACK